jgi:hypothetical protein
LPSVREETIQYRLPCVVAGASLPEQPTERRNQPHAKCLAAITAEKVDA